MVVAISEARRRDLYNSLDELLGTELAETLMAYLPAYESTELATKEDIRRLEDRFDGIDIQFGQVDDRFDRTGSIPSRTDATRSISVSTGSSSPSRLG